jgi:hypothetical protein
MFRSSCPYLKRGEETPTGIKSTLLGPLPHRGSAVAEERTTVVIERYLQELAAGAAAEPVVRALLARAVCRLHHLCGTFLHRGYPG